MTDEQNQINELLDQTHFAEESAILPAESAGSKVAVPQKRSPLMLALLIGVPVVLLLFVVTLLLSSGQMGDGGPLLPAASPTPPPAQQSELDRRLDLLRQDIDVADPTKAELAFPPIDFALDLQDATALQQQRKR